MTAFFIASLACSGLSVLASLLAVLAHELCRHYIRTIDLEVYIRWTERASMVLRLSITLCAVAMANLVIALLLQGNK